MQAVTVAVTDFSVTEPVIGEKPGWVRENSGKGSNFNFITTKAIECFEC